MTDVDDGIVDIRGKSYVTVARRVKDFRDDHHDWTIKTKILSNADLIVVRATISDETGRVLATGTAEEERGRTQILSTSALEVAETSAVGRSLSLLGYLGSEIASAEDVAQAQARQEEAINETILKLKTHNAAVRDNIESIVAIKHYLLNDDYSSAYEAYNELDDDTKTAITLAPTKGGIFTTLEVKKIRSDEWSQARRGFHGLEIEDE